jgi:hypothetical protein
MHRAFQRHDGFAADQVLSSTVPLPRDNLGESWQSYFVALFKA